MKPPINKKPGQPPKMVRGYNDEWTQQLIEEYEQKENMAPRRPKKAYNGYDLLYHDYKVLKKRHEREKLKSDHWSTKNISTYQQHFIEPGD